MVKVSKWLFSIEGVTSLNYTAKEGDYISINLRELRNSENRLLCKVDDITGIVETEGPHKMIYHFVIPVGGVFTVIRNSVQSFVTRTDCEFIVSNHQSAHKNRQKNTAIR